MRVSVIIEVSTFGSYFVEVPDSVTEETIQDAVYAVDEEEWVERPYRGEPETKVLAICRTDKDGNDTEPLWEAN